MEVEVVMGEVCGREDPVGEGRAGARFLSAGWGADHPPTHLLILFSFQSAHGSQTLA